DRIHVEVNLIGYPEPHMVLCPPSQTFDIKVVIDVDVVGGAVAATGAASEGEGRDQIVVNRAQRADRSGRIHDDASGVNDFTELADDFVVVREDNGSMSEAPGMIYVHAHLERLIDGFGSIDRDHGKQFLDRQRMVPAYAVNPRNQKLGLRLDGDSGETRDVCR